MAPTIEARGLGKTYGRAAVLQDLDLEIDGGVVALLGPNGAGKTTLVSILTTLVRPDSGHASVLGRDVVRDAAAVRSLVRVTGQSTSLDELLTGRENLVLIGRLLGLGRGAGARADELLERLDLTAAGGRAVRSYSGGMRRRVDLAASLIAPTGVLFLDEPTTGLDPTSRARAWEDVRSLARAGTTVLLTTQTLDEAEALADRVMVLQHGRVVADGTAAELAATVGGQTLVVLDDSGTVVARTETDGSPPAVASALAELAMSAPLGTRVELRSPTLDDAFAAITGAHQEVAA